MTYIYIGKIVNTHGIKGEIRIQSSFQKKELIFQSGFFLYIGGEKKKTKIIQYRPHKSYDMVLLEGYTNINQVLEFKGQKVFINREDLKLKEDEYLYEDLLGCTLEEDEEYGIVKTIIYDEKNPLLYVESKKNFYVPLKGDYIKKVDLEHKKIYTKNGKSLIL